MGSTIRSNVRALSGLVPALLVLGFDLRNVLIVLLVGVGLVIAGLPLAVPRSRSTWRYGLWIFAGLLGAGLLLTNLVSPAATVKPGPPQVVKQIATASGSIIWASNNTLVSFAPASGRQNTIATLKNGSIVSDVASSPSGDRFALAYAPDASGVPVGDNLLNIMDLYLLPNSGGSARQLLSHTKAGGAISHPTWSTDGNYVYVVVTPDHATTSSIFRVSMADGTATKIADQASEPSCTPDGRHLLFVRSQLSDGYAEIWIADLDGSHSKAIKGSRFPDVVSPVVSPDGKTLAFSAPFTPTQQSRIPFLSPLTASAHGGNWEIWTLPVGGGKPQLRTAISENRPRVVWSPAGQQLAVNADLGLYVIDLKANKSNLFEVNIGSGLVWSR